MIVRQPYPGLRPFESDEADIFFGREEQTDELLSRLNTTRFLAIVGASGCGKSSLVRAGMIPALETGFMAAAGSRWQFVQMRPGSHPIRRLATALIEQAHLLPEDMDSKDALGFLNATLRRGPLGLVEALNHTPLPPQTNLLILVDQFEEIFRFRREGDRDEADAFVALLMASTQQREVPIYVAITMRSDFIGDCALFNGLPEALNQSQYLTPRLTREQQRMAIVGPARVFGGDVEPELVNSLLNDMGTDPDQLPLLQHLLMRLWNCAGLPEGAANIQEATADVSAGRLLTIRTCEAVGGMKRALSNHLDEAYGELSDKQQRIAEILFRRLSERGTDQRDIRRPTSTSEIEDLAGSSLEELVDVVDAFRAPSRSFLVPRYPETIYPSTVLDITHESLIRQWDRLRGWAEAEAQSAETYHLLEQAAHRWQQGLSGCWQTPDLETALAWKDREHPSAVWAKRYGGDFALAMQFLSESEQERKLEEAKAEVNRLRELRRIRRQAWAGAIAVVLLLGVIGFSLFGWVFPHHTYSRNFTKRWGVIHPVGPLPASAVEHRSWTLRSTRKGWFGEVQTMEVIDANHNLTPNNPIGTYLADPDSQTNAQGKESRYEFVFDRAGRVVYEVAWDRLGRMTWGAVHAPHIEPQGAHPSSTKAMFLGADGYPQPQGHSRAEYVNAKYDDAHGFEVELRYSDREGRAMPGPDDAYGQRREFDKTGREIRRTSLNERGEPMIDAAGNAGLEFRYDHDGNIVAASAFDAKGEPTLLKAGYYRTTMKYDRLGRQTEQRFFNLRDEPVIETEQTGAHRFTQEFDDRGNVTSIKLYDTADVPIVAGVGFLEFPAHEQKATFDAQNHPETISFFDQDGKPLTGPEGYHGFRFEYDGNGFFAAVSYFNTAGQPISVKSSGIHRRATKNDDFGQQIEERFYDTQGNPVATLDGGYHLRKNVFDKAGNLIEQTYFDIDGRPVADRTDGAHRFVKTFDRFRHPVLTQYFDAAGQAINNSQGFHRVEAKYDEYGSKLEEHWYDKDEKPANGPRGVPFGRFEYDDRGLLVHAIAYDADNKPVVSSDGIHEFFQSFNDKRQLIKQQFFGLKRKPAEDQYGNHLILKDFDERGRETRISQLRADGSPNWDRDMGIATRKQIWDEENRWIEQSYYDTNDHLIVGPHGYAKGKAVYHVDGRVEYHHFGVDDKLAFNPLVGYAIKKTDTRQSGDTIDSYHGPNGNLIMGPEGYAEQRIHWDEDGQPLSVAWFGSDNIPVAGPRGCHRLERKPGSDLGTAKCFDDQKHELSSLGPDGVVSVIYIAEITDIKQPAAEAGLQAGDILWKYGHWSLPDAMAAERSKGTEPDEILNNVWNAFINERDRLSTEKTPMTIIRNGQPHTVTIPVIFQKTIGMNIKDRAVPISTLEEWKTAAAEMATKSVTSKPWKK